MDTIDLYLDALAARLRLGPDATHRLLGEAEDHLRESVQHEVEAGADPAVAQQRAVERFGTPRQVAAAANGPLLKRIASLAPGLAWLAVLGSLTILAGTAMAWVAAAVASTSRVFGLPSTYQPGPGRIAHWLAAQPTTTNWHAAAAAENADDTLVLRGLFALTCLVAALIAVRVLRRRFDAPRAGALPALGAAVFGAAGVVLLLGGVMDLYTPMEWGRGLWLSDGIAALLATAVCAARLFARTEQPQRSS